MRTFDTSSQEYVTSLGILAAGVAAFAVTVMVYQPPGLPGQARDTASIAATFSQPDWPTLRPALRD